MTALESALRERIAAEPGREVALALIDLQTGERLGINADVEMHAASTMKVPVLYELFRQAESGGIGLDDTLPVVNAFRSLVDDTLYTLSMADDSDSTLYERVGDGVTVRELARLMIARSSNLATNLLIDRLDPARVRESMAALGADGMRVLRGVEDGPAYRRGLNNTTTAAGFAAVLEAIARCRGVSRESCDAMTGMLLAQEFNELIPAGLPPGTAVAHKTGWITGIQHDGGIVYTGSRAPYVLVILTRGFPEDGTAVRLAAQLSRLVWEALTKDAGTRT
jgi:beta-lactamase class A